MPPLLGKAIGKVILKSLKEKKKTKILESRIIKINAFDYEKDIGQTATPLTEFMG